MRSGADNGLNIAAFSAVAGGPAADYRELQGARPDELALRAAVAVPVPDAAEVSGAVDGQRSCPPAVRTATLAPLTDVETGIDDSMTL
jgi:hypothetical protein